MEQMILSRAIDQPPFSDRVLELADIIFVADYLTKT